MEGETIILSGKDNLPQADLLQLLDQLDADGFVIQQVGRREATLEEVFVHLTSEGGKL